MPERNSHSVITGACVREIPYHGWLKTTKWIHINTRLHLYKSNI